MDPRIAEQVVDKMNGSGSGLGPGPGQGPGQGHGTPLRAAAPITVDEALKYSPFSSIIPFGSEPIPLPTLRTSPFTPLFLNDADRQTAKQTLSNLNEEAFQSNYTSSFVQATVRDIQSLLQPNRLIQYRFKASALSVPERKRSKPTENVDSQPATRPVLGTFAEMVLGSTDVRYSYPSPVTPGNRPSKARSVSKQAPSSPTKRPKQPSHKPSKTDAKRHNQEAVLENAKVIPEGHGLPTPEPRKSAFAVVLPSLPPSSQPEDYENYSDHGSSVEDGSPLAIAGTNKQASARDTAEIEARAIDQQQKSQASLKALQGLMNDAFEVEDQMQGDTSGKVLTASTEIFENATGQDGSTATLTPGMLIKLDAALLKVISDHKFPELAVDDLSRLQRLCDGSLRAAESVDLKFQDDWSEDDYSRWEERIEVASTGLKAGRTMMRIMTGGREEKVLSSEEMINSILNVLKNVIDSFMIPIVELRSSGSRSEVFKTVSTRFKIITALFNQASRLLRLLVDLLGKEEVTEGVITTAEFLACGLIFVENSHSDKDSVIGVQKFERFRVLAMDVLTQIFSRYPDQRTFVFDEILTSLERLPVTRQAARHFKLTEGGNIQLVSALILKLVQTSAMRSSASTSQKKGRRLLGAVLEDGETAEADVEPDADGEADEDEDTEEQAKQLPERAMRRLSILCEPLSDTTKKNAQYVIQFLVSRALRSTKTGDDPYRVLLDIFTEDLITVLSSPEWPAAELLLRLLLTSMIGIAEGEKSAAPAKNMALDLMGLMGSAISDLVGHMRQSSKLLEHRADGLDGLLGHLTEKYLEGQVHDKDLSVWNGPYRATLQFCQQRVVDDNQIESSQGYYMTQWASRVCAAYEASDEETSEERARRKSGRLAFRLRRMVLDTKWLEAESTFDHVTTTQGRLAYALTVLNMPFCKAFERILLILLNSMNSEQATVRSKSMKSVIQLLEKDPTILDRGAYVMRSILSRTCDPSPLVRDSAVGLVGKCLALKPELEDQIRDAILARVTDAQVGVRKRSMKMLKDIYLRSNRKEVKSTIADALLHRAKDADDGVSELARQVFEEMWVSPHHRAAGADGESAQNKMALTEQVFLIVKTVQRGESVSSVLDSLIRTVLSNDSKAAAANFRVCKDMVAIMFDSFLDEQVNSGRPGQGDLLRTLTVFAKASPRLFGADQLELLLPYLENLSTTDDLHVYRSAVVIFRWVLPQLSSLKSNILLTVQGALLKSLSKLGKRELNEVIPCLWTINTVLNNIDRLSRVTISCIKAVYNRRGDDLSQTGGGSNVAAQVIRYMTIAGLFGKYCDFSSDVARFRAELPFWKGDAVPSLMVDVLAPFTKQKQPLPVRSAALESLGAVCHAWPKAYLREQVYTAFDVVFTEDSQVLEGIVLQGFREFLASEESRSEKIAEIPNGDDVDTEAGRLGGALVANQNDGVSSSLAQRFLHHIIRIATSKQDNHALAAVEVIGSISRQGLLHPKECGPVLVALETSQNPTIAAIAFREHRTLHQKHETVLDKEYMKAVQQAYAYQKDVVGDALGATTHPFASKLRSLYDVLKISKAKVRKKFLASLCTRIDFEPTKLSVRWGDVPPHLPFSRFLLENIAFFEYNTVEEVLHVVTCMEKVVTSTGTSVAHAIETEVLRVPAALETTAVIEGQDTIQPVLVSTPSSEMRFKQLTIASMILSMVWDVRSFLRRQYGFLSGNKTRDGKSKISVKDLNKNPAKVPGITGDKLWESIAKTMASLSSAETMMAQCKDFAELLSVDHDFKVAAEGEEEGIERPETPEGDGQEGTPSTPNGSGRANGRARKRKAGSETPSGRKGKKKRRSSGLAKLDKESDESHEDWN